MKKILMLTMLSILAVSANSQTIAPALSGQYCPLQNITFTVRLPLIEPGTPVTITTDAGFVPGGGVTVNPYNIFDSSNAITKFNFAGTFGDNNTKQSFKVTSTRKGATVQSTDEFPFRYIKSLKNAAPFPSIANSPCKVLNIGIGSVTVPRCVIQNIPLNFNNVPFSTPTEPNDFCWGKITQYEYQLPNGWSIGSSMSNGSNWIVDDSNVVITSNLGNGDLGKIRVRPSNANCGTGLQNNQLVAEVSISRPVPMLSITGTQEYICSGNANFTLSGIPAGATVSWTLSDYTQASISGCTSCSTVTVQRTGTANIILTLTATVTHCSFTYTKTFNISLGIPNPSITALKISGNGEPTLWAFTATDIPGATFDWYASGALVETNASNIFEYEFLCGVSKIIKCKAINACGISAFSNSIGKAGECFGNKSFTIAPNPAVSFLTISVKKERKSEFNSNNLTSISEVQVLDKFGILRKRQQFINGTNAVTIDISALPTDTYILKVLNGTNWEEYQIIVTK